MTRLLLAAVTAVVLSAPGGLAQPSPASRAVPCPPAVNVAPDGAAAAVPLDPNTFLIGFQPPAPAQQFKRGLHRTPAHKYAAAPKFTAPDVIPPPQFAMIPAALGMYGNDQYGDCVSAQEAVSLCAFTTYCGAPVKPTDAEVIAFARKYGLLNGANLDQVMDIMATKGMTVGGKVYKDGPYATVDYSNVTLLQTALTVGPVNVAIDANALPSGAGNKNGWYAFGGQPNEFPNTDHCITFLAYGPASYCFKVIGVDLPSGVDGTKPAYVCDTWKTLGVVDQGWVMSTMAEAWVRNPTTVGFTPPTPQPPVPPVPPTPPTPPTPPVPVPPVPSGPFTGSIYYQNGVIVGFGPLPAPTAPSASAAEFAAAFKWCPAATAAAMQLLTDVLAKAPKAQVTADTIALALAVASCQAQDPTPAPQSSAAQPGLFAGVTTAGACATGTCSQTAAVGSAEGGLVYRVTHPFGGRFAATTASSSCGQTSATAAIHSYRFAPFGGRFRVFK